MANASSWQASGAMNSSGRTAGLWIALASLSSVVFMAYHPTSSSQSMGEFVEEIRQGAVRNGVVHGALIACSAILFCAFTFLASRLGMDSFGVRAGLVAYGMGLAAMTAAASLNGFILAEFLSRYHSSTTADLETVRHIGRLIHAANQVCSRLGVVALSVAIVAWSIALVRRPGPPRAVGVLGGIAGGVPIALLLAGFLPMNVHGVLAFVLAQTVWDLAIAVLLIGNRV